MHLAKSGRLIVKLNAASAGIRPGEVLIDAAGRRVGKIVELIGPVSAPYASVIPMTDRTARLAGAKVFAGRQQPRQQARPSHARKQQRQPHGGSRERRGMGGRRN